MSWTPHASDDSAIELNDRVDFGAVNDSFAPAAPPCLPSLNPENMRLSSPAVNAPRQHSEPESLHPTLFPSNAGHHLPAVGTSEFLEHPSDASSLLPFAATIFNTTFRTPREPTPPQCPKSDTEIEELFAPLAQDIVGTHPGTAHNTLQFNFLPLLELQPTPSVSPPAGSAMSPSSSGTPTGSPNPGTRSGTQDRIGVRRVQKPCPRCGAANHIRRTKCEICQRPKDPPEPRRKKNRGKQKKNKQPASVGNSSPAALGASPLMRAFADGSLDLRSNTQTAATSASSGTPAEEEQSRREVEAQRELAAVIQSVFAAEGYTSHDVERQHHLGHVSTAHTQAPEELAEKRT